MNIINNLRMKAGLTKIGLLKPAPEVEAMGTEMHVAYQHKFYHCYFL